MTTNRHVGGDVLEHLAQIIPDTPATRRVAKQENVRLATANLLRRLRKAAGLTQKEMAARMGVTQGWVSKIESALHDQSLQLVVAYLDALSVDLTMEVRAADAVYRVTTDRVTPEAWSVEARAPRLAVVSTVPEGTRFATGAARLVNETPGADSSFVRAQVEYAPRYAAAGGC